MSITSIYIIPGPDDAEVFDDGDGQGPEQIEVVTYQVECDGDESRDTVLHNAQIPVIDDPIRPGSEVKLKRRRCRRVPGTIGIFQVECEYRTQKDFLAEREYHWRTIIEQREAVYGYLKNITTGAFATTKTILCNSCNDPFDPTPMIEDAQIVVEVTLRMEQIPPLILQYRNAVNSDTFAIDTVLFPEDVLRISGIEISPVQYFHNIAYREVTAVFSYKEEGWNLKLPDIGWHKLEESFDEDDPPGTYNKVRNTDENGESVGGMVFLNGSGGQLEASSASTVVREYQVYEKKSFYALFGSI